MSYVKLYNLLIFNTLAYLSLFDFDVAEVEGVHGVATQSGDASVGEVENLVVVEHHDGRFGHDQAVHGAIKVGAAVGVGLRFGAVVQAVKLFRAEMRVVGTRRAEIAAAEERQVVFGVGVVGNPRPAEPRQLVLRYLLAQRRRRVDVDFDVDSNQAQLLLDVLAEVQIVVGGGELGRDNPLWSRV